MMIKDVEGLVKDLKAKGDIHVAGTHKNAWFKDPDGNILALVGE